MSDFTFKNKELLPFSEGRRAIAQAIGVRLFNQKPEDATEVGYPGLLLDCHAIIYICLHSFSGLAGAQRNPDKLWTKILEWADANITINDYEVETKLVADILNEAFAKRVTPVSEGEDLTLGEL